MWYAGKRIEAGKIELAIDDPGLLYGATVFTTLRVYNGTIDSARTNWRGHCDRLRSSLQSFGWREPDWERLKQGAQVLMAEFPVLRIALFADGREWIVGRSLPADLLERQQQGIVSWLAEAPEFRRSLAEHKTGNYLSAWLALNKAKSYGAKEAILVDASGNWLETSTGNLWGWRDGKWWTPPLEAGILPGLMRKQLIDWLHSQNEMVEEEPWSADLVEGFEAIAYTNSVVEIVPIHTIIRSGGDGERGSGGEYPSHQGAEELINFQLKTQNSKLKTMKPSPQSLSASHFSYEKLRSLIPDTLPVSQIG